MKNIDLIKSVKAHALKNYEKDGWDFVVECFDDAAIQAILDDENADTVSLAIKAVGKDVKYRDDYRKEIQATAF